MSEEVFKEELHMLIHAFISPVLTFATHQVHQFSNSAHNAWKLPSKSQNSSSNITTLLISLIGFQFNILLFLPLVLVPKFIS